jgi:hypothetical protein
MFKRILLKRLSRILAEMLPLDALGPPLAALALDSLPRPVAIPTKRGEFPFKKADH